jgi:membrane protein implicated in regulation of membrane protease activity
MISWLITSRVGRSLALAFAFVVSVLVIVASYTRAVVKNTNTKAERDALKDRQRRLEAGRSAQAKGDQSGLSPEARVRKNDGAWQ